MMNRGQDGSRQVTAAVDAKALGQNFTAATVTQNGDLVCVAPQTKTSELMIQ
jgi:hypothetical protein